MTDLVRLKYVGKKPVAFDNLMYSGTRWDGPGDIKAVAPHVAKTLLRFPDQWALVGTTPALRSMIDKPTVVEIKGIDGESIEVTETELERDLEKMNKAQLVAYAKRHFNADLLMRKSTKELRAAIEELQGDAEEW